jgi:hypothetical protein
MRNRCTNQIIVVSATNAGIIITEISRLDSPCERELRTRCECGWWWGWGLTNAGRREGGKAGRGDGGLDGEEEEEEEEEMYLEDSPALTKTRRNDPGSEPRHSFYPLPLPRPRS